MLSSFEKQLEIHLLKAPITTKTQIIRVHTRHLATTSDITFPLDLRHWISAFQETTTKTNLQICATTKNIFEYNQEGNDVDIEKAVHQLAVQTSSEKWALQIEKAEINSARKSEVKLWLNRAEAFQKCIECVLLEKGRYGASCVFPASERIKFHVLIEPDELSLTALRLRLLSQVGEMLVAYTTDGATSTNTSEISIQLTTSTNAKPLEGVTNIKIGPVLNQEATSTEFLAKRAADMQQMALHKYGAKLNNYSQFFERLGNGAVAVELLATKPQKSVKVNFGCLEFGGNKNAAFLFYNCARMGALFEKFEARVREGVYPSLPEVGRVEFGLLDQEEEWELCFTCLLQFPRILSNCISDIKLGYFSPHNLVAFLANLAKVFSAYYRRIRILTDPRKHLFAVLFARIYLLKALQQVLHNGLRILGIEPINQM